MNNSGFNKNEKRLISGISFVMAIRTLSTSLVTPILSIYAMSMYGSNMTLAGIAVGIFGISQLLMQIPIGILSDKWGRRQATIMGLSSYMIGTILAGFSTNINHLIFARLISGAGAVTGVTMAWLTDGIEEEKRNSALSFVGISIGAAVITGFTLSPIIAGKVGMPVLFHLGAALILFAILYTLFNLNNFYYDENYSIELKKNTLVTILKNHDLARLNITGFISNFILISTFFIMPILLKKEMEITSMWKIFVPIAVIGTCLMYFFARKADESGTVKICIAAILFCIAGATIPVFYNSLYSLIISFIFFYSGHCILSPVLPAAVSRYPNHQLKGSAMGVLNAFHSIGSSLGGIVSGVMLQYNPKYLFLLLALLSVVGLFVINGFKDYN